MKCDEKVTNTTYMVHIYPLGSNVKLCSKTFQAGQS